MPRDLDRSDYIARYGPTTGDRVRLGDTGLIVEVEDDSASYGDELLPGCGKTTQAGMQVQSRPGADSSLDMLIMGVLIVDPLLGVVKGDIGISDGRIVGIGRAGNPDVVDDPDLVIGPHTSLIPGAGLIATPGGVDSHVHLSAPGVVPTILGSGITTIVGMGLGGVWDVGVNPARHLGLMLDAWSAVPVNVAFLARGGYDGAALEASLDAGASGFKIHEDFGGSPAVVDRCLTVAEQADVAVAMHTDSLNESGLLRDTIDAIDGRTVHAYHVEGAGGGHIPGTLELVSEPNVIASSTTPTIPFGVHTAEEALPMAMIVHHQSWSTDAAVAASRIRARTIAAESHLQELGAIGIINSDSMGMGRGGEVIRRTWQLAHVMAAATGDGSPHNRRARRYLAKYTINPAITHGLARHVGSLEPGKLADIVLWKPALFGAKPEAIIKSGFVAWGSPGDTAAPIRNAQPRRSGPMFGGLGDAPASLATIFVAAAAIDAGIRGANPGRSFETVSDTRSISRADLVHNTAVPRVVVPSGDEPVLIDGDPASLDPVSEVPLSRRYFLG